MSRLMAHKRRAAMCAISYADSIQTLGKTVLACSNELRMSAPGNKTKSEVAQASGSNQCNPAQPHRHCPIVDYNRPAQEDSQKVRKRYYRENDSCKQGKVFQVHDTCPKRSSIAPLTRNRASRLHKSPFCCSALGPLMAQSGHFGRVQRCPLSGGKADMKRTWRDVRLRPKADMSASRLLPRKPLREPVSPAANS
jgi:hypothetical protein